MEKHGRQWEKAHNSKIKLMHAAHDLFVERGYTDVSVNDICEKAQLTKGAFYHHFSGKEALYRQLLVPNLDDYIQAHITNESDSSPLARLRQLAGCVFDVSKSMGRELTAQDFIRMLSCQASDIYGTDRLYTRLLSEALQDGLDHGKIQTGLDLEGNIMLFACLMSGFLVRWSSATEADDARINWDALLDAERGLLCTRQR